MNLNSMKAKLGLIGLLSIVALLLVAFIGQNGIRSGQAEMHEVGAVRMPSVQGLLIVNEAQTAIKAAQLGVALYENDYTSVGKEGLPAAVETVGIHGHS